MNPTWVGILRKGASRATTRRIEQRPCLVGRGPTLRGEKHDATNPGRATYTCGAAARSSAMAFRRRDKIALIVLVLAGLACAWRYSPLSEFLTLERIREW